jgi:predicted Zn-dependent protease
MMIIKTAAVYFDGESSTPQNVELFLDKNKEIFYFETQKNDWINWGIKESDFKQKSDSFVIQNKEDVSKSIIIKDSLFINNLKAYLKETGNVSWHQKLINLGFKVHSVIAITILGFIGLSYLYIMPYIAEKAVVLVPESYDTNLGNLVSKQSLMTNTVDSVKSEKLNQFAKELKLNNNKNLHFTVVNSDIVNAYALPNGDIVVFSGILDAMKDYDELVALIGHEVSHVNNRDSMKMLCRNLSGYLFVSAILGDTNGIMAIIGDNANTLQSLSFSRKFEHQADIEGFQILITNHVNPKGMSNLFKRLQEDKSDFSIPEFLSSHPITTERINDVEKMIQSKSFSVNDNPKLKTLFEEIKQ